MKGMEETKGGSPVRSSSPTGKVLPHTALNLSKGIEMFTHTTRHQIPIALSEPKVQSPHKARRGFAPRRIEVERKKREYSLFNITEEMERNGVIGELIKAKKVRQSSNDTIDEYSLTLFDDLFR